MSTSIASAASLACASVSATTQAIGSPTKRTLSVGSAGRGGFFRSEPSLALERQRRLQRAVVRRRPRRCRRASTPGIALAAAVSIDLMRPCATVLRRMKA